VAKTIAILGSRGIPAKYGGFETFAEELSRRLVGQGVNVTVYCESEEEKGSSSYNGVTLCHVKAPKLGPLSTLLFDLRCLWHARKAYDVVYMLGYGASLFCFIPRLFGTEVWINMDGVEWKRSKWSSLAKFWLRTMEGLALHIPDRIICDAEGIKKHLLSRHSKIPVCSVIPYGAPIVNGLDKHSREEGVSFFPYSYYLVVCRLEPENHVLEIVEGFSGSTTNKSLIIVGQLDSRSSYSRTLLTAAQDRRVMFMGPVYDKPKLQALRRNAFGYFHGHSVGGTNPSLLEALGCGRFILAHDNLFNREVAGEVAFFFKTVEEIPSLIGKVESLNEEETRDRFAKGMKIIASKYNWDKVTEAYLSLLEPTWDKVAEAYIPLLEPKMSK
jgi:glycosyltransferase involved in cell wall biosynthesis